MNRLTLDTTVLARGIVPPRRKKEDPILEEHQRLHNTAKTIMEEVESGQATMNVPSAAIVEIAAVCARLTGKEERGVQSSDYVKEHGNIVYDMYLLDEAIQIAAMTKISGFDSIFMACAKVTSSTLITDDKQMYESAVKAGIDAKLLRAIR